jgi:VIT1/CCC1 family predicted Fe2+/Mn2+ transporter
MAGEEQSHARVLKAVSQATRESGAEGGMLARLEGRHRAVGGNALRAAVLGANDGLVSTLSLVMGVAGGLHNARTVALAGVAGMLAGACAMAMGEWLSVQSARELAQKQLAIEKAELEHSPEEEMEELALIYQSKGLPKEEAHSLAQKLIADKATALDTLAREELGIDPEELGGSAWEAAIASFILFFVGAVAPVTPFIFVSSINTGIAACLICSAVALVVLGFITHLLTGRGMWYSGMRQLVIGMLAAGVTYGMGTLVGRLFGVNIAG